jgi:hypothetical protein
MESHPAKVNARKRLVLDANISYCQLSLAAGYDRSHNDTNPT